MNQDVNNKDTRMVLLLNESEYSDVESRMEKFERMFNVILTLKGPRVVKLNGGSRDCTNARIFIKATLQSQDNETRVIHLPPTTDDFIESIEIKSLASITKHTPDGSYHIRGKKINVSMAMSLLEENAQLEKQIAEMQTTPWRTKTNKASRQLSCALQETLTKVNRRGNYVHATDAVKRAIVSCLSDETEDNDQIDTISDKHSNNKTMTDNTGEPDIILIDDDSDDEIIEIVEDDDDDDVMIIETSRKNPNDNMYLDNTHNITDDSIIIIDSPCAVKSGNQKASVDSEHELSTMTVAFSELPTPSTKLQNLKDTSNETFNAELDFSKASNNLSTSDKRMACPNNSSNYPQPLTQPNTDIMNASDETDGEPITNRKLVIPPFLNYRTPRRNDLRYIVIDGSNVAMAHGKHIIFSCRGIRICVEYFLQRGHELITVFLPHWRKCRPRDMNSVTHRYELDILEKDGYLVYTPSRRIRNTLVAAYDDRFIIELADREDGIVVTNDEYRDLKHEKYSWRNIIENGLLQYSFVHDHFMVPNDPLGRYGPTLDRFLRHAEMR